MVTGISPRWIRLSKTTGTRISPSGSRYRRPSWKTMSDAGSEVVYCAGIGGEPPIDVEKWATSWRLDGTFVAIAVDEVVGSLHVEQSSFGFGEIGMMVARDWRGRGVGSALVAAAIEWGRENGLHKLTL